MKFEKNVLCKCEKCNKPFKAYMRKSLCKECEEKAMIKELGVKPRMVRSNADILENVLVIDKEKKALENASKKE